MSSKKKNPATPTTCLPALKFGCRVRCTDDGVQGRIVWANAVSVKIQWDDGEQVTWRRDALAGKPIEFLDTAADSDATPQAEGSGESSSTAQNAAVEIPQTEQQGVHQLGEQVPVTEASNESVPQVQQQTTATTGASMSEPVSTAGERTEPAPTNNETTSTTPAKPKRQRKEPVEPKEKKLSALDAAAKLLAEEGHAMTCQEMIDAMAAKGYWKSPNGATPQGTLYSAILRELNRKGSAARFRKTERGKFACNTGA
jgi:hypothetical protein